MDLHGPLPPTHEGYRYWLTFIDDASSHRAALRLKRKSDTFEGFKTYKAFAENQLQAKIKELQDDKGGEFMSNAFLKFTDECGIHRRHTTRNRPQQNGVAERANRTMGEDISAMLYEAKLLPSLWGEALNAQIHIWNRLPTSTLKGMTPHEAWFKRKPDVSHLRVWGCLAYVFIQKDKCRPLQPHMEQCVFVGYPTRYKGWSFYNPTTQKFVISERAEFDERVFPGLAKYRPTSPIDLTPPPSLAAPVPATVLDLGGDSDEDDRKTASLPAIPNPLPAAEQPPVDPPADLLPAPQLPPAVQAPLRRTLRVSRPPGEWWKVKHAAGPDAEDPVIWSDDEEEQANLVTTPEPRTYKLAMGGEHSERWREATTKEYNTLVENGTWEIVDLPEGEKAIGSGWVFRVKHHEDGSIERFKARIVAKGYSQRPGLDYNESFAPTFRPATLRIIMALTAIEDLELRSVDITSAFTNGDLDEEIYMKQPEGFHIGGPNQVCRLRKSLYGLKQSARQWNKKLHSALTEMGFKRIESDRSVYIYSNEEVRIIVPIYIDDITFASKSSAAIDKYVSLLSQHFKCRDLGHTRFLLGVAIERDRPTRTLKLHQRQFILDLLNKFGMSDCKPVLTPLPPKLVLSHTMSPSTQEDIDFMSQVPYLSAVGSLQYLAIMTHPDIAHSVAYLARFNANPGPEHWKALKHLFRYVKGTVDHKLTYHGNIASDELFLTYTDASHGDCVDTGRPLLDMLP
jgi:transposase InsO family protein